MAGSGDTGHRVDDPARSGPAEQGRGSPATPRSYNRRGGNRTRRWPNTPRRVACRVANC